MTFAERLQKDHPDKVGEQYNGGCKGCPQNYGYCLPSEDRNWCSKHACAECWDREIPSNTAEFANVEPEILDSGELTTFETGAVRSGFNADGTRKGRCDLLPLRVLAKIWRSFDTSLQDRGIDKGSVFDHIADFQDTGNARHLMLALNSFTGYLDFPTAFLEVAKHYEEGAEKYGERNWEKGLPINNYVSSMVRHYLKWLRGDTDEPHDRAFVWNLLCCMWECEYSPRAKTEVNQDAPVIVLEHATGPQTVQVAYLCDKHACTECNNPDCHHTQDINHAVNFESVQIDDASGGLKFIEKSNLQATFESAAPGLYELFDFPYVKGADSVVYTIATGRPLDTTSLEHFRSLSIHNVCRGVGNRVLVSAPAGALFYHEGDVWLRTDVNADVYSVYAVRLRDGKPEHISGNTLVTSVENIDFH